MEMDNLKKTKLQFTLEEKLVAAVWYHERLYTGMSYDQLACNFTIRFKSRYPNYTTLKLWEKKLFKQGRVTGKPLPKRKISLARLMYVPYVKESFVRFPDLKFRQRTQMLGIAWTTLKEILKHDLTPSDLELLKSKKVTDKVVSNQRSIEASSSDEKGTCEESNKDSSDPTVPFGTVTVKTEFCVPNNEIKIEINELN